MGVPLAIVIAGALIALAVYFGGGSGGSQQAAGPTGGEAAAPTAPSIGDIRPVDEQDHIRGAAAAKITIIEYSDLECPFCQRFHPTVAQVLAEHPNDVRWVYRHFPLEAIHPLARGAAVASECAGEQGRFWEFTDLVFAPEGNPGLDQAGLTQMAQQAGVSDVAGFTSCLSSGRYDEKIDADIADAQAAGGRGTPYSIVEGPDGERLPINGAQPYATVKSTIDQLL